jgi:hypothetical protein
MAGNKGSVGRCAVCHGDYQVRRDGMIRWHDDLETHGVGMLRRHCGGSGTEPAEIYEQEQPDMEG